MPDLRAHRNACISGHRNSTIRTIAASPGGNFVATIADDGYLIIWDARRGEALHVLGEGAEAEEVFSTCTFLDDRLMVVGSERRLRVLELRSWRILRDWPRDGSRLLRLSARQVLCGSAADAGGCEIIDCWDGTQIAHLPCPDSEREMEPIGVAISQAIALFMIDANVYPRRPTLVALALEDGRLVWRRDLRHHTRCCLADGTIIALATEPLLLSVIDIRTGRVLRSHDLADRPGWLGGFTHATMSWDATSGLLRLGCHPAGATIDLDDWTVELLAEGTAGDLPMAFDMWHRDHAEDRLGGAGPWGFHEGRWTRPGPGAEPLALALGADGGNALVAIGDGRVLVWDLAARRLVSRARLVPIGSADPSGGGGELLCAAANRRGDILVVADQAGVIWWFTACSTTAYREARSGLIGIGALAVLEDDSVIVVLGRLWSGPRQVRCLDHDGHVRWSRDDFGSCGDPCDGGGGTVVLACENHLRRLDAGDGRDLGAPLRLGMRQGTDRAHEASDMLAPLVAASACATVAVGGTGSAIAVDLADPATAVYVPMHYDGIAALALSADGHLRAVGEHYHHGITLEDARTGQVRALHGHLARVTALAFTPDATRLVSAGADGQLIVWEVASGRLLATYRCLYTPAGEEQRWEVVDGG